MNYDKRIWTFCILLCVFVIIFDQATKFSALAFIPSGEVIPIFPCLNLLLTFNFGTSFGLLNPSSGFQSFLIIILTVSCLCLLVYLFFKLKTVVEKVMCSILIGGAIGNLLDRFIHGAVIDFIDIYCGEWHWPAFNLADAFISCSAIIMIVYNLSSHKVS